jgi:UDP-N-acetyl-D-mannosaminuronic acid transferase (WecB/TagA/CpsF family)
MLLNNIESKKPKYIIINLGGGTQEKLGAYLKTHLSYKPAIICTGAAIAFLTGQQASIPTWGDKFFLGWLFRCIQNPKLYVPRYFKAFRLAAFMFRYGQQQPL